MAQAIGTTAKILTCVGQGRPVELTARLATSGEGEVWHTNWDGYVAKLYFNPSPDRIRKLEVMVTNPPADPNAAINHPSFAWPKALLQDASGRSLGFLMPKIADSVELIDVYNPQRRRAVLPGFNWLYLHVTAMNIASITQSIHAKGYVLGDIKPQNILVNNQALPSVIDTDSFQVRDPQTGEVFRCPVGSEGFTPPELLGQDLAAIDQTAGHDRFRQAWKQYAIATGLLSGVAIASLVIAKVLMAQQDIESMIFGTVLFIGLLVLWAQLAKPTSS